MQLHCVLIGIAAPEMSHLICKSLLELLQFLTCNLILRQILAIHINSGRRLLTKLLDSHIKLFKSEPARNMMKDGKEHIASPDLVIVLILLAPVVVCCIIALPVEQFKVYPSLFIRLVQSPYEIAERITVVFQLLG